jgi:hypothetical protein
VFQNSNACVSDFKACALLPRPSHLLLGITLDVILSGYDFKATNISKQMNPGKVDHSLEEAVG